MLTIPSDISWQPVPGEIVLFDARDGSYHALNGTAAEIWRGLAEGQTSAEIGDALAQAFDASREDVDRDVEAFVADALARGLIVDEGGTAS